jgi:hypothetical protein
VAKAPAQRIVHATEATLTAPPDNPNPNTGSAPGNTTVEVEYASGKLLSLTVVPPERASAVKWASCVAA